MKLLAKGDKKMSNISKVNIINEIEKGKFVFEDLFKGDYFILPNHSPKDVFMKAQASFGDDEYVDLKNGTIHTADPLGKVIPVNIDIKIKNIVCL